MRKSAFKSLTSKSPKCRLCKLPLTGGVNGSPATCNHTFHFGCLENWTESKATNGRCKCPEANCDKYYRCIKIETLEDTVGSVYYPIERDDYHCPLCRHLIKIDFASPNTCEHYFCYACLSKHIVKESVCPIDRRPFNEILIAPCIGAPPIKTVLVQTLLHAHDSELAQNSDAVEMDSEESTKKE